MSSSPVQPQVTVRAVVITQDDPQHPDYNPEEKDED